jgi:RNA polymerase sigma-70 factor (ECF subfamily)
MAPNSQRFLDLLETHRKILYKICNAYCQRPEERDDLAQEIVVQLWTSFAKYDATLRFSTWMYRIALNVAISFYRRSAAGGRRLVAAGAELLEVADPTAEASEDALELRRCIARLDELDRALVLLYLDGNSHREIAEVLGISETNVGTKIGRLKARLRQDLAGAASN